MSHSNNILNIQIDTKPWNAYSSSCSTTSNCFSLQAIWKGIFFSLCTVSRKSKEMRLKISIRETWVHMCFKALVVLRLISSIPVKNAKAIKWSFSGIFYFTALISVILTNLSSIEFTLFYHLYFPSFLLSIVNVYCISRVWQKIFLKRYFLKNKKVSKHRCLKVENLTGLLRIQTWVDIVVLTASS